jgi:hypothetical protein
MLRADRMKAAWPVRACAGAASPDPPVGIGRGDSEETNDGRLICALLDPVVVRSPGDAPDESSRGNRKRIVWIEVGPAVHPQRAGENQREAIGRVGVRGAHVVRVPLHQHEIRPGLVQAAVERRHFAAVRRETSYPVAPLDRAGKGNLSLRRVDCAGNRRFVRQSERQRGEERSNEQSSARQTNLMIRKEGVR